MASLFTITESLKPMERLLDGISLTAQRSRQAILAALFVSLSVIYMSYNYISTYRDFYSNGNLYSILEKFSTNEDLFHHIDNVIEKIMIPNPQNTNEKKITIY